MSKKYIHFVLDSEKPKEKKIKDYIEKEYSDRSMKVLFNDLVEADMEKKK